MERAWSLIEVKSLDAEKRILRGIATTPAMDREDDVVMPEGAEFKLPIPFLWQHDPSSPIGEVTKATVTKKGIEVEIQVKIIPEPGKLKDCIDEAWQSIKYGLVRGLSIGFKGLETSRLEDSFGRKFIRWLWLELSAVTIPANAEATILSVKSADHKFLTRKHGAASGKTVKPVRIAQAASGHQPNAIKGDTIMAKTLAEQLSAFEETQATKGARMKEMLEKSEGATFDASQQEEFDTLETEVKEIESHIKRLGSAIEVSKKTAAPVNGKSSDDASASRGGKAERISVQSNAPKLEKGIAFAQFAKTIAFSKSMNMPVHMVAEQLYADRNPELVAYAKAAVAAHTSSNQAALIGNYGGFADFVEFLRPMTILGKFGATGIPGLRQVPFRVPLITQTGGASGYWVGEGKGKPLTAVTNSRTTLGPTKVANIAVATMELLRDSSPSAERILRDDLAAALVATMDLAFIDPANAGSANVKPAGVTNGAASNASAGATAADARADAQAAMAAFVTANNPLTDGVWIMSGANALALSLMLNALGQPEFPGITVNGGTYFGLPVIVSNHAGATVALVKASDIWFADEGGIDVAMSTEASLEMSDAPTQDSGAATPVASAMVSMFATNSVAFRAERTINWMRRRASAVSVITAAAYAP